MSRYKAYPEYKDSGVIGWTFPYWSSVKLNSFLQEHTVQDGTTDDGSSVDSSASKTKDYLRSVDIYFEGNKNLEQVIQEAVILALRTRKENCYCGT
jgi:hypothetical protein